MSKKTPLEDQLRFVRLSEAKQETKLEAITEHMQEEDFRFDRVRLDTKRPRYELPAPTKADPDETELTATFEAVILMVRPNFFQSDEDKEAGREGKEKRELYILRPGRFMPERIYISNTALFNWKLYAKKLSDAGKSYFGVLTQFSAEQIKRNNYTWSKPLFDISRDLESAELEHVDDLRELVKGICAKFQSSAALDKYEANILSVDKGRDDDEVEEVDETKIAGKRRAALEDDEDEAPKSKKNGKKKPADDEDEDEAPAKKKSKKASDEDDDLDDATPPSKRKKADEDEDEEDEPKSKKKSKVEDEDEDEDEAPKSKKKSKAAEEDEDEDEPKAKKKKKKAEDDEDDDEPKSKGRKGYPSLDEDDD